MTHLITVSFDQEEKAVQAFTKLQDLEKIGDITIYEMVVVAKNPAGEVSILEALTAEKSQALSGMAVGTIIGALAGPVGMVTGMLVGTLTGEAVELDDYGFEDDFFSKVTDELKPGTSLVVMEVEEDDPVFIDSTLTMMGTEPNRTDVNYEYTKYSDEELEEFEEDILALRDKLKMAVDEEKEKFRNKITKIKGKRKDRIEELKEKKESATETEVKVSGKEKKIGRIRSKIEKHQKKIAELEQKLAGVLQKEKEEVKQPEEQ